MIKKSLKKLRELTITRSFIFGLFSVFVTGLLLYVGGFASGPTTHYWITDTDGSWSNPSNWSTGEVPDIESPVVFNGSGDGDVTIDVPISVASITIASGYAGTVTTTSDGPHTISGEVVFSHNQEVSLGNGVWDIGSDLNLEDFSGTLNLLASSVSIAGDLYFGGTVNSAISTIILDAPDGTQQNIFNTNGYTLNNLTKISTSESVLGFDDGEQITISGELHLEGASLVDSINLRPVDDAGVSTTTSYVISALGTLNLSNISIEYSTCSGATVPCLSFGDDYRESTPFSTTGWIPARAPGGVSGNLALWLRSDAFLFESSGDLAENGDTITEWADVSVNNNGVNSVSLGTRPIRGTADFNYHPAVDFDGVDDYLSGADGFSTHSYYSVFRSDDDIIDGVNNHGLLSWNIAGAVNSVHGYTFVNASAGLIFGDSFNALFGAKKITHTTGSDTACDGTRCAFAYTPQSYDAGRPLIISVIDTIPAYWFIDMLINNLNVDNVNGAGWGNGLSVFTNRPYFVGAFNDNSGNPRYYYDGKISEVISYSLKNTLAEATRINSYLAIKYGITLNQSTGGQDYIASDGVSEMWDKDIPDASVYDNNIAGIGRDDASGLYQTRSRNQEPVNDDINSIELDPFDVRNPTDLDNMEFLSWGNNGLGYVSGSFATQETEVPLGYTRLVREWKIQENGGNVGDVTVMTDVDTMAGYVDYVYMLVDADGDFSDATPVQMSFEDIESGQWVVDYNFVGGEYVTFASRFILYEFASGDASSIEDAGDGSIYVLINGALRYDRFIVIQNQFTGSASDSDYTFGAALVEALPAGDYDGTMDTAIEFNDISLFNDALIESAETIDFLTVISGDTHYYDLDNDTLERNIGTFSIIDDDSANVFITPTQIGAAEGENATYTIVLTSEPPSGTNVVVIATPGDLEIDIGDGAGAPVFVTFTSANWNIPQTVTVTAVDDDTEELSHVSLIVHTIHTTLTTDVNYLPVVGISDVSVLIPENDVEENNSGSFVSGCTDPSASNYNLNATIDNGSCIVSGCTNATATNYNPSATSDDGSCVYQIPGCTNVNAINYNPNATLNNGSCIMPVPGCTNSSASNYNPLANTPDGSCIYFGCTDPGAENYDPGANSPNGSCVYPGCTDPSASNYSPNTTVDDGSCTYSGCTNPEADNYDPNVTVDDTSCVFSTVTLEIPVNPPPTNSTGFLADVGSPTFGSISQIITGIGIAIALGFLTVSHLLYGPMTKMKIASIGTRLWSGILGFLGVKKKPWGIVYDSKTKQPLDPVYVTLADENGKLVATSVTDIEGRYGFLAKPGVYKMYAHRSNYEFPSTTLQGKEEDEVYKDLYFGELIKIEKENEFIARNIPMDPLAFDWNEFVKNRDHTLKTFSKQKIFVAWFTKALFSVGFGLSILAVVATPNVFNALIVLAYVGLAFLERKGLAPRPFGMLKDINGNPASFAVVHVFSEDTGLEVSRKVADELGRYVCFLPNGDYNISIDKRNEDGAYSRVVTNSAVRVKKGYLAHDYSL
jgi:hypothetical protein